jgi:hypothetical protein
VVGSEINLPDHISQSLETGFWVKYVPVHKFFDGDPDPGSGINIPDPQKGHSGHRRSLQPNGELFKHEIS